MIRNAFATRLASVAGAALSIAGFAALDAGAQGTVTLSGGTGNSCQYSTITVSPNGNLNVSCQSGNPTSHPVCTISGSTTTPVGQGVVLTANCTPSATSYSWTGPGAPGNQSTFTFVPSTAGASTFTVAGTNSIGTGPASAAHTVTAADAPPPPDVPKNCSFSSNPASPIAGQAATITINCTNSPNAYAWYQYEGGSLPIPSQTATGTQSVTFPTAGKYSWWLQAGNQLGSGDIFQGSVNVGGGSGNCPAVPDVVGPQSAASLLNLRFDLRPGQTGTQEFTLPLDGFQAARITGTPATSSETPKTTIADVWVSDCPGHKPSDLPAGCQMELWGSTGQANFYVGQSAWSSCPATGKKYVNIKHRVCQPSGGSINYCSHYLKVSGQ